MPRPKTFQQPWVASAVKAIVRFNASLASYAVEHGMALTDDQLKHIEQTSEYTKMLWDERQMYAAEIGADPLFNKDVVLGQLLLIAQQLVDQGKSDKAIAAYMQISKMKNWVASDNQTSVFAGLSADELDEVRRDLAAPKARKKPVESPEPAPDNLVTLPTPDA